jgi:pimeloyl-ACP methyl ester carboxylesterase
MSKYIDYSLLNIPAISTLMFHPQKVWFPVPEYAEDIMIPVDDSVSISARFYGYDAELPTVLFFHGNGEIACQFDPVSKDYEFSGTNFLVVDFRGYGLSSGIPSFQNMITDSSKIYRYCVDMLNERGFNTNLFIKGRSLGCYSAVEIAANFQDSLLGLIIESGSADIERILERIGVSVDMPQIRDLIMLHVWKVKSIKLPLLTICGEMDELMAVGSILALHNSISSDYKDLLVISNAGHNDLWLKGRDKYFDAVREFVFNSQT